MMPTGFLARVAACRQEAEGVRSFVLVPGAGGPVPAWTPGAHVEVQLAPGVVRAYSLTNGPGENDAYHIAVKLDPQSRGGSRALHREVQVGSELQVSAPKSLFALNEAAAGPHLLVAGGIGITPLLSMARHLAARGDDFELHYFNRSRDQAAFADVLLAGAWADRVHLHCGHDAPQKLAAMRALVAGRAPQAQLYTCGPAPFMAALHGAARAAGWSDARFHQEHFAAAAAPAGGDAAFEVELAQAGVTLHVPAGRSIVQACRDAGIEIETSCEQGVCGTCETRVLSGRPDHRDVYLSAAERAAGHTILPCVSRSSGPRLVLAR